MSDNTIILGDYIAIVRPEADYDYLDEVIKGSELLKMNFSHITDWVDRKALSIEINLWSQVPTMYQYDVYKSIMDLQEESPYANKDIQEQLKVFKRLKNKYVEEQRREDEFSTPIPPDEIGEQKWRNKKSRLRNKITEITFLDRETTSMYVDEYLAHRGTGILKADVPVIARLIVDWKRL